MKRLSLRYYINVYKRQCTEVDATTFTVLTSVSIDVVKPKESDAVRISTPRLLYNLISFKSKYPGAPAEFCDAVISFFILFDTNRTVKRIYLL